MSEAEAPRLFAEPFAGFEHNCFERHDLRLYRIPVIGPVYFLVRRSLSHPVRIAWLAYLQTWMLRREYHIRMRGMTTAAVDADIIRMARSEAADGAAMSPLVLRLALILTRRSMPYFNVDHELDDLGPLDEAQWTDLIDTALRVDIFLCSRPRFRETLSALPHYPNADLGTDGYLFLVNFLSILGLRSELGAGPRRYLQRKINIVLHSLGVDIDALRSDLHAVQDEIGRREIPSGRAGPEPIDVSIALFETDLQAAWELARTLEVLELSKASDSGPEDSEEGALQPQF